MSVIAITIIYMDVLETDDRAGQTTLTLSRIRNLAPAKPGQCSTSGAIRPTGGWLLCWSTIIL